ncbi:glycine/betaine ABC transporter substrate-bindin g protein [Desulfonema ishimotonii]|uniref:Glycine/betaine ABC transporter substrate-bindin g protein n=1 Tax=Desulfonema ishimotonii TaxID=45657 RepID=A0A401FQE0_9BACT|nr:choline ABC transporter substrate-binding protein [Desulfonema ishimotonii]GBC59187.1 glycine/betaine ABC transporter substrate-bindin g protein [Desulfonema ishimotonii]
MIRFTKIFTAAAAILLTLSLTGFAGETDSCNKVRFSDVGWSDITSTTALTSVVMEGLGYDVKTNVLAVPVTFASLKNKDIDIFLGLWMPTMTADIEPYKKDGSVETVRANLTGAKYTLAVPRYVYDAGVKDFADIAAHKEKFKGKIYGIEPGNDGNRLIQSMIDKNAFGLKDWKVVESSEQGMLGQVRRAVRKKDWIVFLGWEPHPMNTNFDLAYLSGGDEYFGPDFGGATVHTTVRKGYLNECPNVARLLKNTEFTLKMENQVMGMILDAGMEPLKAAEKWLRENPDILEKWLEGVTTTDGKDGLEAVRKHLNL